MTDLLGPYMPYINLGLQLCGVFYIVFRLALVFWVARDSQRRGAMAWFWGVAALIFGELAWVVYMVVRPPETLYDAHERELEITAREAELHRIGATCPHCFKPVEPDFLICPTCMKRLKKQCTSCGRPVKTSWSVCPYCKARQVPSDRIADESAGEFDAPARTVKNRPSAPAGSEA